MLANTLVRFTPGNRLQHCLIVRFAGGPGAGVADGIRFRDNRESCEQLQDCDLRTYGIDLRQHGVAIANDTSDMRL